MVGPAPSTDAVCPDGWEKVCKNERGHERECRAGAMIWCCLKTDEGRVTDAN